MKCEIAIKNCNLLLKQSSNIKIINCSINYTNKKNNTHEVIFNNSPRITIKLDLVTSNLGGNVISTLPNNFSC